jgi:type IV pilus assembly protein PilO
MPDLRQTRKKIKTALAVMVCVDLVAAIVLVSPLVGSTDSRRQELNQLWSELQLKTRQVEPLKNLPERVKLASRQISEFYEKRFPEHESQILTEFGKLASTEGVTIAQVKYKAGEVGTGNLQPVEMEADLGGNYVALAKFINALERDQMFFIINSITLGGEQQGPVKLNMKVETYLKARMR